MKVVVQRVSSASVEVGGEVVGSIEMGILVLVAFSAADRMIDIDRMVSRLLKLRIFDDSAGKMNLSVSDVFGSLLIVSQFTLLADLNKGNRPSFGPAAPPEQANHLYQLFLEEAVNRYRADKIQSGRFGANMQVKLCNDGPVTFVLE